MTGSASPPPSDPSVPAWKACLAPEAVLPPSYFEGLNEPLAEILRRPPRRVLELGCAAGRLAALIREKHPGIHYTGIEIQPEAAAIARTRIDRVIERRLEEIDFDAEGIGPASIDTFIAGDVLEHLYDPWHALLRIRPLLTADAQVAICVPNVRNLAIHAQLHNQGTWKYDRYGLLDITHIRFFALGDAIRMLQETGYVLDDIRCNIDPRFAELYQANRDKPNINIQAGRLRIDNLSKVEFQEYCALQYVLLAHPGGEPVSPVAAP